MNRVAAPPWRVAQCRVTLWTRANRLLGVDDHVCALMDPRTPMRWLQVSDIVLLPDADSPCHEEVFRWLPGCRIVAALGAPSRLRARWSLEDRSDEQLLRQGRATGPEEAVWVLASVTHASLVVGTPIAPGLSLPGAHRVSCRWTVLE